MVDYISEIILCVVLFIGGFMIGINQKRWERQHKKK